IRRLSTSVDVDSRRGRGTVLMARIFERPGDIVQKHSRLSIGGLSAVFAGETEGGDGWAWGRTGPIRRVMVVDGLGHGPEAADASRSAAEVFEATLTLSLDEVLASLHLGLRHTRGAAVAIADVDSETRKISYAGVGNVSGRVLGPESSEH